MTLPKRQLGLYVTAAIVVANMIGTGVFTSTGFSAKSLHDPMTILLAWVIGGALALCGATAYAELSSMMPKAGGEYVYLREAYHPAVGFMSGWVSLTAGFSTAIAASALAFSQYLAKLIPGLDAATPWADLPIDLGGHHFFTITLGAPQAIAIALIAAITVMHAIDTKVGGWVQAGFTAAKVVLIVLFILGGFLIGHGDWGHLASQNGGLANVGTKDFAITLMYVSFAYSGWNAAAYIAGDVENPGRNLPRALLLGTGIVMVLYVLLNLIFFYAVPSDVLAGPPDKFAPIVEVGDAAARSLFGDSAGALVTSVIALALVSSVSAMVMAGPRVYAAMAADRALPRQLGRYNTRGVPTTAVIAQGILGSLFVLAGDLGQLIRFAGFTLAIFAALTVGALFVMRRRGLPSPYRAWGYPFTPLAFIALSAWIAYAQIDANPKESLVVAIVLAIGGVLYYVAAGKPPGPTLPEARVSLPNDD